MAKLLQELFAQGFLSEDKKNELQKRVGKNGRTEEEIILAEKLMPQEQLFELKSKILGIPYKKIKEEDISPDIFDLMPEEASVNYKMSPFFRKDNLVQIGMVYPEDMAAQNALRFLANQEKFRYQIYLISPADLVNILKQRKNLSAETSRALSELKEEKGDLDELVKKSPVVDLAEEAPIIKMVLVILRHAMESRASDIHIEPGREQLTVRFRINGTLQPSLFLPKRVHSSIASRIKIMSGLKIDETRVPQDGRFSATIENSDVDFRVSTFPTLYGEKVELRVLDTAVGLKSFEELGLEGKNLDKVMEAIKKPYGLILSTGPTGSGKTTTQYALLKLLNRDTANIVTIEDPIEYSVPGVNQSQVKPEIGYTFASGLRQILRQDPNVIMVGEIRDEETADMVINAALTGHIVLSTLHTNSSSGVVPRLLDMGVRPFLIPSTLRIVISQRLVRTLCPKCKTKIRPPEKIRAYILDKIKSMPAEIKNSIKISEPFYIYSAKGCSECQNIGYAGRIGLFEVLPMSDELTELILKSPVDSMIFKLAQKQGMLSMEQEGIIKVLSGQTTIEEVTRATEEK